MSFENGTNQSGFCPSALVTPVSGLIIQYLLQITIVALNSLVLYVIYTGPRTTYRQPAFKFVANLAVCDILVAISLFLYSILGDVLNLHLSPKTWTMLTSMTSIGFNASVNSLIVIAVDRFVFITYNQAYKRIVNDRNIKLAFAVVWLAAILPFLLVIGGIGVCSSCTCTDNAKLSCYGQECSTISVLTGYTKVYLFGLLMYLIIGWSIIVTVYVGIFLKVHYNAANAAQSNTRVSSRRMQREFRLARTLLIVIVVFIMCWLPLVSLYGIDFFKDDFELSEVLEQIIFFPAILNSLCNPIIYAIRIKRMRRILLPCCYRETKSANSIRGRRLTGLSNNKTRRTELSDSNTATNDPQAQT